MPITPVHTEALDPYTQRLKKGQKGVKNDQKHENLYTQRLSTPYTQRLSKGYQTRTHRGLK